MSNNPELHLGLIASRILDVPLMITKSKLDQILCVVSDRIGLDKSLITQQATRTDKLQARVGSDSGIATERGVAIIPIYGTLVHRAHGLSALSGLTSYTNIRSKFTTALNSPDVDSILLDIDSPGGEVAGVFDLIDFIYASRGTKPIVAIINERGYSAAYGLASAADRIYIPRTGGAGSIGVIMLHVDKSEANKRAGIVYTPIYAGARKVDGSPNAPLSDAARSDAQAKVNTTYNLFVSTVARNIDIPEGVIRNTQAGTYTGQAAVNIGLAHEVLSYQEVINQLTTNKGGIKTKMSKSPGTVPVENELDILKAEVKTLTEQLANKDAEIAKLTESQITQEALDTAIKSERERCTSILEACNIANTSSIAMNQISDGSSLEATHKMIMSVLAERSNATNINSAVNPATTGRANPLLADARKRADAIKRQ